MRVRPALVDDTLWLEFEDTASGNAFSRAAAQELVRALQSLHGSFREGIFAGKGRFFCTGGHLDEYAKMPDADSGRQANRDIARALDELERLPAPTLALVQGDCLGGGLELMACFDRVIATPEACFGFWQRRAGLSFGWGGGARLGKRLAPKILRRLAADAATLTAQEALAIGLIDEVVPAARLEARARAWISRMRRWAQRPLVAAKAAEAVGPSPASAAGTEASERRLFESLWWEPEHRAALSSRPGARKRSPPRERP